LCLTNIKQKVNSIDAIDFAHRKFLIRRKFPGSCGRDSHTSLIAHIPSHRMASHPVLSKLCTIAFCARSSHSLWSVIPRNFLWPPPDRVWPHRVWPHRVWSVRPYHRHTHTYPFTNKATTLYVSKKIQREHVHVFRKQVDNVFMPYHLYIDHKNPGKKFWYGKIRTTVNPKLR